MTKQDQTTPTFLFYFTLQHYDAAYHKMKPETDGWYGHRTQSRKMTEAQAEEHAKEMIRDMAKVNQDHTWIFGASNTKYRVRVRKVEKYTESWVK